MVCLDSDFLVGVLRNQTEALAKLDQLEALGHPLSTTTINAVELYKGAALSANSRANRERVKELLKCLVILPLDLEAAKEAGPILAKLRRQGQSIGDMDGLIGGIVLSHKEVLVTRNLRHYNRIPSLRTDSW